MIVNKVFNEIFSTYSNIAVLRELQHSKNGLTGREVGRLAGISPPSALKALMNLFDLHIINMQIGGRDHIYTLNFDNTLVKDGILPLLKLESDLMTNLSAIISKKLKGYCTSIILYGSVARKEEDIKSDFDICIVFDKSQKELKLHQLVSELQIEVYKYAGISLSSFYIKEDEFRTRARLQKPPVSEIIKEGIILSGKTIGEIIHGPQNSRQKYRKKPIH
jgi:predicted nucleotidyltransferase